MTEATPALRRPIGAASAAVAILCAALLGGQAVAVKTALDDMPWMLVVMLRFAIAGLAIAIWATATRHPLRINKSQLSQAAIHSFFTVLVTSMFVIGMKYTTSVHAIVLINSAPIFVAPMCHYLLPGFPLRLRSITGLVIAFLGVVVVFAEQLTGEEFALQWHNHLRGDLIVLCAAFAFAAKTTYTKAALSRLTPVQLAFWSSSLTVPLSLIVLLSQHGASNLGIEHFTRDAMLAVLFQGLVVSAFGVLAWTALLSRHRPDEVMVFQLFTPIIGLVLGWLLLEEKLTWTLWCGSLLVVWGTYRTTSTGPRSSIPSDHRQASQEKRPSGERD